jgi:hypothetical protein
VADLTALARQKLPPGAFVFGERSRRNSSHHQLTAPWGSQLKSGPRRVPGPLYEPRHSLQGIDAYWEGKHMGLITGSESYCNVTHIENGRVMTRRIHQILVQAANGQLYTLTGNDMPDSISLYSSQSKQGQTAEILLNKPQPPSLSAFCLSLLTWKHARDIVFMILGMLISTVLAVVAQVITRMLHT